MDIPILRATINCHDFMTGILTISTYTHIHVYAKEYTERTPVISVIISESEVSLDPR